MIVKTIQTGIKMKGLVVSFIIPTLKEISMHNVHIQANIKASLTK